MPSTSKITVQATIHADRLKVWNYYNSPEHIMKWNFADPSWHCPKATNDLKVGGTYFARMEAKDGSFGFDFEATYLQISEPEYFVYAFGGRQSKIEFEDLEGDTKVTVTFDAEAENSIEMQKNGWQAILDNFKNYTETN